MTLQSEGKNHHFECSVLGEHFKEAIVGSVSSGANHFSLKLTIKIERLQRRRSWTCTAAFSDDLGFANPVISATALFLVLWLALIAVEEVLQQSAPKAWKDYPSGIIALRILAIGFLGPIAEELAFSRLTDVGSQAHTNWSVWRRVCDCSALVHGPHTVRPGNTGADLC